MLLDSDQVRQGGPLISVVWKSRGVQGVLGGPSDLVSLLSIP